ncbi:porin family protein [Parabacteroides sp. FAFU027]|uniref:porin family protein n=1 Tax=Parabacteroides sp. FAFU027 TaxID=2922715 RepID=UPI001FAE7C7F|nr:porin family protein [Parabacteroides sp. FAFU027]
MKRILLIAFAMYVLSNLQAQTKVGITGGFLPSYIIEKSGSQSESLDNLTGFSLGLMVDKKLGATTSLQYQVQYAQKGASGSGDGMNYKIKLNYIEIPVMLAMHFSNFQIKAGPYAAYGITGTMSASQNGVSASVDMFNKNSTGVELNRFDAGLNIGAGLSFTDKLILNLNYEHGLANLYPSTYQGMDTGKGYNRNVSVSLGYYF